MFSTAILVYKFFPFSEFVLKVGVLACVYAGSALPPSEFSRYACLLSSVSPLHLGHTIWGFRSPLRPVFGFDEVGLMLGLLRALTCVGCPYQQEMILRCGLWLQTPLMASGGFCSHFLGLVFLGMWGLRTLMASAGFCRHFTHPSISIGAAHLAVLYAMWVLWFSDRFLDIKGLSTAVSSLNVRLVETATWLMPGSEQARIG
jgi:hypothetical protein